MIYIKLWMTDMSELCKITELCQELMRAKNGKNFAGWNVFSEQKEGLKNEKGIK